MDMKFYVNFKEDTGEIWKATNECDDSTPYIEVDAATVSEFTTGVKNMNDYIVVPSVTEKKFEIKFKHRDLNEFDVDKSIHRIPITNTTENENAFMIIQENGSWTIKLSEDMKETLTSTTYYKDKSQLIYVTKKNDPNILLDTMVIKLYNVLYSDEYKLENQSSAVANREDISLFCGKVFEQYLHVVK
jgi:hypothetical protein